MQRLAFSKPPDRVVIDEDGYAVPASRAEKPEVVFVRRDGWSLGAPFKFEKVAYEMWKEEWVCFINLLTKEIKEIEDYVGR